MRRSHPGSQPALLCGLLSAPALSGLAFLICEHLRWSVTSGEQGGASLRTFLVTKGMAEAGPWTGSTWDLARHGSGTAAGSECQRQGQGARQPHLMCIL